MAVVYRAHELYTDEVMESPDLVALVEAVASRIREVNEYKWTKHTKDEFIESTETITGELYVMLSALFTIFRNNELKQDKPDKPDEYTTHLDIVVNLQVDGNLNGLELDAHKLLKLALDHESNAFIHTINIDQLAVHDDYGNQITTEEDDPNRIPDDVWSCVEVNTPE